MSKSVSLAVSIAAVGALVAGAAQSRKIRRAITVSATSPTPEQIAGWDIDIRPDGQGAPPGHGSVKDGEKVYMDQMRRLSRRIRRKRRALAAARAGQRHARVHDPVKTVGSYFPVSL